MQIEPLVASAISAYVSERATLLMLVTDRQGTILEANRYAEELVGRALVGGSVTDIIVDLSSTFDLQRAIAMPSKTLLSFSTVSGIPQTLCVDVVECGERLLMMGELTHGQNESLRASLITLNAEVGNLNRSLQKEAAELERVNELKNRFIGMAAHDLRNPIGAIHGLAAVLREEAETTGDEAHAEVFAMMGESSGFMLALIEDLLTAITIESGEMRLAPELTDLTELVSSSVRLNRVLSEKKRVHIVLRQDALPATRVDRLKLRQVLDNLISNGVKFSTAGSAVTVSVARSAATALISVSDAGPGIPPEEFHKLFKPFSRTTVTLPDGEKSSGLGLSIARRIVEAHGGSVSVESEVGVGTTFHVSLPLQTEINVTSEEAHP